MKSLSTWNSWYYGDCRGHPNNGLETPQSGKPSVHVKNLECNSKQIRGGGIDWKRMQKSAKPTFFPFFVTVL